MIGPSGVFYYLYHLSSSINYIVYAPLVYVLIIICVSQIIINYLCIFYFLFEE